mmetsp:Transcript_12516/g.24946  ORF Transcript_12516/g.24946 Transcript_12516/m.24946 type:complete len:88 (+) Transcript_12516:3345-3608(+)
MDISISLPLSCPFSFIIGAFLSVQKNDLSVSTSIPVDTIYHFSSYSSSIHVYLITPSHPPPYPSFDLFYHVYHQFLSLHHHLRHANL